MPVQLYQFQFATNQLLELNIVKFRLQKSNSLCERTLDCEKIQQKNDQFNSFAYA